MHHRESYYLQWEIYLSLSHLYSSKYQYQTMAPEMDSFKNSNASKWCKQFIPDMHLVHPIDIVNNVDGKKP